MDWWHGQPNYSLLSLHHFIISNGSNFGLRGSSCLLFHDHIVKLFREIKSYNNHYQSCNVQGNLCWDQGSYSNILHSEHSDTMKYSVSIGRELILICLYRLEIRLALTPFTGIDGMDNPTISLWILHEFILSNGSNFGHRGSSCLLFLCQWMKMNIIIT